MRSEDDAVFSLPRVEERARLRGWARRTLYGGGGYTGAAWRGITSPVSVAWDKLARRRLESRSRTTRLSAPAIAIGNVTVGGSGKTSLVQWLLDCGLPPGTAAAVLTRGYGREGDNVWVLPPGSATPRLARLAGDEPALLARHGVWVGVAADRARAARALLTRTRPDVFLLDDALQHRRVARALDLVVFTIDDLEAPARCLPAGPLRQGASWRPALGGWVVVGADPRGRAWPEGTIGAAFAAWWSRLPGTGARWESEQTLTLEAWVEGGHVPFDPQGREIVAFAGVARPSSVARSAAAAGIAVAHLAAFPDHWYYRGDHIRSLLDDHPRAAFVTTEKDAVKLDPEWFESHPVGVIRRRLVPSDPALLRELVRDAMGGPAA